MNRLSQSSSPYLLQHQHNPVNWQPWDQAAIEQAKRENKLLIISIGYSACHWCHVMERESFEDTAVARVMNAHYICIKVDREERPDIDHFYMSAVQIMSGRGGWPLNCVALPDGRPIWGGTYFSKDNWMDYLEQIARMYRDEPAKVLEYAEKLAEGMAQSEALIEQKPFENQTPEWLDSTVTNWKRRWDTVKGGPNKAPKFPLPSNYNFLMDYGHYRQDEATERHVKNTLEQMAMGGIYDQIGGGFARYSVDANWKVPHFEKMLYDNAQLISLYSKAFRKYKSPMFLRIAEESIEWVERELSNDEGGFFSALDADSEGVEGKFYSWTLAEWQQIMNDEEWRFFQSGFVTGTEAEWEEGLVVLRNRTDETWARDLQITEIACMKKWHLLKTKILKHRNNRIKPHTDHKTLTAWNAMMVSAYCEAFMATGKPIYAEKAESLLLYLKQNMYSNGELWHARNRTGQSYGSAMLDDYAFLISASLEVHRISGKALYLIWAKNLMNEAVALFNDPKSPLFWFSTDNMLALKVKEVDDNVIPASNSVMAHNLSTLGLLFGETSWLERANEMLKLTTDKMINYGEGYSNWALLRLYHEAGRKELAICGPEAHSAFQLYMGTYAPAIWMVYSEEPSDLPIFQGRSKGNKTLLYLCEEGQCKKPVEYLNGLPLFVDFLR